MARPIKVTNHAIRFRHSVTQTYASAFLYRFNYQILFGPPELANEHLTKRLSNPRQDPNYKPGAKTAEPTKDAVTCFEFWLA